MPKDIAPETLCEQICDQALDEYRSGLLEIRLIAEIPAPPHEDPMAAIIVGVSVADKAHPQAIHGFIGGMREDRVAKEMIQAVQAMHDVASPDFMELTSVVSESSVLTMVMLLRIRQGDTSKIIFCRHPGLDDDDAVGVLVLAVDSYRQTLAKLRTPSA